jgi:hypothetical protein
MNKFDDDDQPVTRERLKIELEALYNKLNMERLERQRVVLMRWQVGIAVVIWSTLFAMMIAVFVSREYIKWIIWPFFPKPLSITPIKRRGEWICEHSPLWNQILLCRTGWIHSEVDGRAIPIEVITHALRDQFLKHRVAQLLQAYIFDSRNGIQENHRRRAKITELFNLTEGAFN